MSILSGFKKIKKHEKTSDGYKRLSYWTSSQTVEFDDGKTAQEKLGGISGITNSLTSTSTSLALSAKAGKDLKTAIDNADPTIPSMTYAEYKANYAQYTNKLVNITDSNGNMQAAGVDFNNSGTHVDATNVQGAIAELDSELTTVNSKLVYVESDILTVTAAANSNNLAECNLSIPSGYSIVSYLITTINLSGSWHIQLTYIDKVKQLSFHNYGALENTWTGKVCVLCMKN